MFRRVATLLLFSCFSLAQQPAELTIAKIFAEGGITGRSPEGVKWSPDNKRITFILRNDAGDRAELQSFDPVEGKLSVLISADKMASLAPQVEKLSNPRKQEYRRRYGVPTY